MRSVSLLAYQWFAVGFLFSAAACTPGPVSSVVPSTPAPMSTRTTSPSPPAAALATYTSSVFRVSLQYPAGWKANVAFSGSTENPRYEGDDGFFMVDAMSAAADWSLDQAAEPLARHKLRPYGDNPDIIPMRVGGQEARLIVPREEKIKEAALVARYLEPLTLGYNFFWLYADRAHIEQIAMTIRFLPPTR